MVLEINSNQPFGVQSNFFTSGVQGRYADQRYLRALFSQAPDNLNSNTTLNKYANVQEISNMISANPQIQKILDEVDVPLRINVSALADLKRNHLPETKRIALGIISNLPANFRNAVDLKSLQQATELHDLGKVLIPAKILNKNGALSDSELKVMRKHSQLGYELLKSTDLDDATLDLIKHHHQNAQKTGYPDVEDNFVSDINLQILSLSDMYSALREKRSYKPALSKNEALAIIHKDVKQGKVNPFVFKALVNYANMTEQIEGQVPVEMPGRNVMKLPFPAQFVRNRVGFKLLAKLYPQRQIPDGELPNSLSA